MSSTRTPRSSRNRRSARRRSSAVMDPSSRTYPSRGSCRNATPTSSSIALHCENTTLFTGTPDGISSPPSLPTPSLPPPPPSPPAPTSRPPARRGAGSVSSSVALRCASSASILAELRHCAASDRSTLKRCWRGSVRSCRRVTVSRHSGQCATSACPRQPRMHSRQKVWPHAVRTLSSGGSRHTGHSSSAWSRFVGVGAESPASPSRRSPPPPTRPQSLCTLAHPLSHRRLMPAVPTAGRATPTSYLLQRTAPALCCLVLLLPRSRSSTASACVVCPACCRCLATAPSEACVSPRELTRKGWSQARQPQRAQHRGVACDVPVSRRRRRTAPVARR